MKSFSLRIFILLILSAFCVTAAISGKVYVVPGSDSSVTSGLNVNQLWNSFDTTDPVFCHSSGNMALTMDSGYRNSHLDSLGHPVKFTWWAQGGSMYGHSLNSDPWVTLDLIQKYHSSEIISWGDEISYHYHGWVWNDPDGDTIYHWNQSTVYKEFGNDFDITLGRMILDNHIYPASFRSGWNAMDTGWENRLDEVIPFRLDNWFPAFVEDTTEPIDNCFDWRLGQNQWTPYHPSTTNYQLVGNQKGWETRHEFMTNLSQSEVNAIFASASTGSDQIICVWSHIADSNFLSQFSTIHERIWLAKAAYPNVDFEYCTAREAYQKYLHLTDGISPNFRLLMEKSGDKRTLHLSANELLYQSSPITGVKSYAGPYSMLTVQSRSSTSWSYSYQRSSTDIYLIGIGGSDTSGNPAVSIATADFHNRDLSPALNIQLPGTNPMPADKFAMIGWDASDPGNTSTIDLYYGTDTYTFNGTMLGGNLSVDSAKVFRWDTSLLSPGNYFIYGIIQDGEHIPVVNFADNCVIVSHTSGDTIPPEPVINLYAMDTIPDEVKLTWSLPSTATDGGLPQYYLVYRSSQISQITSSKNLYNCISGPSTTQWIDKYVTSGTTHYAFIGVDENSNLSLLSNIVFANPQLLDHIPPASVSDLATDTTGPFFSIHLYWSIPGPANDGEWPSEFRIYRSLQPSVDFTDPSLLISTLPGSATYFNDTTVSRESTYYYVMTSIDSSGNESMASNEIFGQPKTLEVIIDNTDPGFTVLQGNWTTASTTPAHYGIDYRYNVTNTTISSASVEWRPVFSTSGIYRVYVWYNQGTNRATDALYTIHHGNGTKDVRINQQVQGGVWNDIGRYYFLTGNNGRVILSNYCPASPGMVVMADAVRFLIESFTETTVLDWSLY